MIIFSQSRWNDSRVELLQNLEIEILWKMDDYLSDEIDTIFDDKQSSENRIESRGNFYGNMMHPQKLSFADMFAPVSSGNVFERLLSLEHSWPIG